LLLRKHLFILFFRSDIRISVLALLLCHWSVSVFASLALVNFRLCFSAVIDFLHHTLHTYTYQQSSRRLHRKYRYWIDFKDLKKYSSHDSDTSIVDPDPVGLGTFLPGRIRNSCTGCVKSLATFPLCKLKFANDMKSRIRIRTKSLRIYNTAWQSELVLTSS